MTSYIRVDCDWTGEDDGETRTEETCEAHYYKDHPSAPEAKGWYHDGESDYCPEHQDAICRSCGQPNLRTLASFNAGGDWCCTDCTGETDPPSLDPYAK